MPDGLVIERLPVGIARGIWRVIFVAWGGGSSLRGPSARPDADIRERVTVSGVGADLQACGSLAGASDSEQEVVLRYSDNGLTALRMAYTFKGETVAHELIALAP